MKWTRRLLALLLAAVMSFSLVTVAGGESGTPNEPVDNSKRINDLLAYSDRLHQMTEKYALKDAKEHADEDPFANARIIVKSANELDYTGSVAHVNGYNDWHVIQYRTPEEARKAAEMYEKVKGVQYAAPDTIMSIAQQPGVDEFLSWGYAPAHVGAYNYATWLVDYAGGVENLPTITVAVIDTGADSDHEYLVDRLVPGYDFVNNDADPEDDHYHGTHVSGTVIDGTLPNVKIMALKCLDEGGYGNTSDIVNAMEYAYLNGCDAANLSLRGPCNAQGHPMYEEVIANGTAAGTVYCVAAGNDYGSDVSNWCPANVEQAITVAAHDRNRRMADFSNVGSGVDITAPGVDILSARKGGGYHSLDGTSMATPHVAAAVALVRSYAPDMSVEDVTAALKGAAIDEGLVGGGTGLLNVADLFKFDPHLNGEGSFIHFTSDGQYAWGVDGNTAFSGNAGADNSVSVLTSKNIFGAYQEISFEYKVSSEQGHDFFRFCANGETLLEVSGDQDWQTFTGIIPTVGETVLTWEYSKDASGSAGSDKAWIRNVVVSKTISSVINTGSSDFFFEGNEYPWIIDGDSAKSGNAGVNNSVSEISATHYMSAGVSFVFKYKVSCGSGDRFEFLVNGQSQLNVTTETGWTQYEYQAPADGQYVFTFRYTKDGSGASGSDAAWVKEVEMYYTLSAALNAPGSNLTFISDGTYPWIVEQDYAKSGNSGRSSSTSSVTVTVNMHAGDTISFRYRVSSETNYDFFKFFVNGSQLISESGDLSWREYSYEVPSDGTYEFEWRYTKDGSVDRNDDCVYVDDVSVSGTVESILGDCDGDGIITVSDALLAMRYAMGIVNGSALNVDMADADNDGIVTINDALIILRWAMDIQA